MYTIAHLHSSHSLKSANCLEKRAREWHHHGNCQRHPLIWFADLRCFQTDSCGSGQRERGLEHAWLRFNNAEFPSRNRIFSSINFVQRNASKQLQEHVTGINYRDEIPRTVLKLCALIIILGLSAKIEETICNKGVCTVTNVVPYSLIYTCTCMCTFLIFCKVAYCTCFIVYSSSLNQQNRKIQLNYTCRFITQKVPCQNKANSWSTEGNTDKYKENTSCQFELIFPENIFLGIFSIFYWIII